MGLRFIRRPGEALIAFDAWILRQCTKFSHWLQRTTGLTNFFVVKVGTFIYCTALIVDIMSYWFPGLLTTPANPYYVMICLFLLVTVGPYDAYMAGKNEEQLYQGKPLILSKRGPELFPLRILWLVLLVADWIVILSKSSRFMDVVHQSFSTGTVIVFYFSIVAPLPPGQSKVRQWVNAFIANFRSTVET